MIPLTGGLAAAALLIAGCSGGSSTDSVGATEFSYLGVNENPTTPAILTSLSTGACQTENKALPLKTSAVANAGLDQKIQLLAGQKALPALFAGGGTPALTQELFKAGQVKDLTKEVNTLGISDDILPVAKSAIENLYGGKLNELPFELNVEGFWYNKTIFAKNNLDVPTTWDELLSAAAALDSAGVTPFATGASGQGWPVTRLISGYLFREVGSDAMANIRDGKAKLTDPDYVKAAEAIAKLGKSGYLGKSVGSVDYNGLVSNFLTGKAGIMYMGSWVLSNFNDKTANQIGSDAIGFFPFPAVAGGAGSIHEIPANVGGPTVLSADLYNPKVGDWVKCIAQNFGATALKEKGLISGFKVNKDVKVNDLTALVQKKVNETTQGLVWFEAYFNSKASTTAWNGVASLVNGTISPEKFMAAIQADL